MDRGRGHGCAIGQKEKLMDLVEVARVRKQMKNIALEKSELNVQLEAELKAKQEKEGGCLFEGIL